MFALEGMRLQLQLIQQRMELTVATINVAREMRRVFTIIEAVLGLRLHQTDNQ